MVEISLAASAGSDQTTESAARLDFNPNFLETHSLTPLGISPGRVLVAMPEAGADDIIAALDFATDMEVVPIIIPAHELEAVLAIRSEPGVDESARFSPSTTSMPQAKCGTGACRSAIESRRASGIATGNLPYPLLWTSPATNARDFTG
jgi:hypothetical protein